MKTAIDEIPGVVAGVRRAFEGGRTRPLAWRRRQLEALGAMLRERKKDWLEALRADLGKSSFEGWLAELNFVKGEMKYALDRLPDWMRPEKVSTPLALQPAKCRVHRQPYGVVLIIGPWNYPLHLVFAPLVGAVAAGNCAVLKPSEVAENTGALVGELVPRYLDPECIAVVEGAVPETTRLLEQRFDYIFYTGNGAVGKIVMRAAAEHLTPVTLELGGKSPTIVDRSANLEVAARRIVWGKFFNAGQTCVAPDYVLAHRDVAARLATLLASTVRDFYGDDPKQSPDYARVINGRHLQRLRKLLDDGETVCGGEVDEEDRYLAPTILRGVSPDSPVMSEEIFGPILPILEVPDAGAAISFVNERPKPLALYVFADDRGVQEAVLGGTSSGGACVNEVVAHLGAPGLPFGGVGESGMGAYHGRAGFETFSHRRSVLHKSVRIDPSIRYPPYKEEKTRWLRRLV
jgi:aldehyde dehydrogenase (NAD+)